MRKSHLLLALVIGALLSPVLPAGAKAQQATQAQVVAACGTPNSTYPAGTTKPLTQDTAGKNCVNATVTATATTTATASSTPTAVSAGPNAPLNINLFSALFEQPTFGGTPVDGTHGLPVNCIVGCSGGPADESAFTPGTTAIVTGGFFQTTATSNPLTTGQAGSVQMTSTRSFFVNLRNNAGAEAGVAAVPLQVSLANTAANATPVTVNGAGTAGSASTAVETIQGIAGMTKLLVTPDSVALPANQSVNTAQVNGVTTLTGAGAVGTGAQRVAVGQDATTVAGMAPGTVAAGTAPANTAMAGCQYNATNPAATDTQALAVQCDAAGRLRVNAQPATQNAVSGTANSTSTSTTSLIGAVTSNRIYVSAFSCANTGASASLISFQDGSGGTTLWTTIVPAGGGSNLSGNTALFKTTSGNAVFYAAGTASTTIYCSAAGYSGP